VRLLPWGFFADSWSPRPIDHLALGFHVDFHIDVSGVDVCVSQPVADHVDVVSRSQQMHGRSVADGVRVEGFGGNRWLLGLYLGAALAGNVADTEARNG